MSRYLSRRSDANTNSFPVSLWSVQPACNSELSVSDFGGLEYGQFLAGHRFDSKIGQASTAIVQLDAVAWFEFHAVPIAPCAVVQLGQRIELNSCHAGRAELLMNKLQCLPLTHR